nr:GNAT family N-acetyltransferase [uncultured Pseudomonas sp.]
MNISEATLNGLSTIAMLISESNKDVALRFGLNANNCPKHPSFCTPEWVKADFARGEKYFVIAENATPIGCVAYESPRAGIAYLNRLSVLPKHRKRGVGTRLVEHFIQYAETQAVQIISIGVIEQHLELQRWYRALGFKDGESKEFPHLPFVVKYMSYSFAPEAAVSRDLRI